jgi:hypothetical protein
MGEPINFSTNSGTHSYTHMEKGGDPNKSKFSITTKKGENFVVTLSKELMGEAKEGSIGKTAENIARLVSMMELDTNEELNAARVSSEGEGPGVVEVESKASLRTFTRLDCATQLNPINTQIRKIGLDILKSLGSSGDTHASPTRVLGAGTHARPLEVDGHTHGAGGFTSPKLQAREDARRLPSEAGRPKRAVNRTVGDDELVLTSVDETPDGDFGGSRPIAQPSLRPGESTGGTQVPGGSTSQTHPPVNTPRASSVTPLTAAGINRSSSTAGTSLPVTDDDIMGPGEPSLDRIMTDMIKTPERIAAGSRLISLFFAKKYVKDLNADKLTPQSSHLQTVRTKLDALTKRKLYQYIQAQATSLKESKIFDHTESTIPVVNAFITGHPQKNMTPEDLNTITKLLDTQHETLKKGLENFTPDQQRGTKNRMTYLLAMKKKIDGIKKTQEGIQNQEIGQTLTTLINERLTTIATDIKNDLTEKRDNLVIDRNKALKDSFAPWMNTHLERVISESYGQSTDSAMRQDIRQTITNKMHQKIDNPNLNIPLSAGENIIKNAFLSSTEKQSATEPFTTQIRGIEAELAASTNNNAPYGQEKAKQAKDFILDDNFAGAFAIFNGLENKPEAKEAFVQTLTSGDTTRLKHKLGADATNNSTGAGAQLLDALFPVTPVRQALSKIEDSNYSGAITDAKKLGGTEKQEVIAALTEAANKTIRAATNEAALAPATVIAQALTEAGDPFTAKGAEITAAIATKAATITILAAAFRQIEDGNYPQVLTDHADNPQYPKIVSALKDKARSLIDDASADATTKKGNLDKAANIAAAFAGKPDHTDKGNALYLEVAKGYLANGNFTEAVTTANLLPASSATEKDELIKELKDIALAEITKATDANDPFTKSTAIAQALKGAVPPFTTEATSIEEKIAGTKKEI